MKREIHASFEARVKPLSSGLFNQSLYCQQSSVYQDTKIKANPPIDTTSRTQANPQRNLPSNSIPIRQTKCIKIPFEKLTHHKLFLIRPFKSSGCERRERSEGCSSHRFIHLVQVKYDGLDVFIYFINIAITIL